MYKITYVFEPNCEDRLQIVYIPTPYPNHPIYSKGCWWFEDLSAFIWLFQEGLVSGRYSVYTAYRIGDVILLPAIDKRLIVVYKVGDVPIFLEFKGAR